MLDVGHDGALNSIHVARNPLQQFLLALSQLSQLPLLAPQQQQKFFLYFCTQLDQGQTQTYFTPQNPMRYY